MAIRKSFLALLPGLLAAGYGAVLLFFRLMENTLIFHPERGPLVMPPASLDLPARRVDLLAPDSVRLAALEMPPPQDIAASAPWLLYLHGNGGCLSTPGYQEAWSMLRKLGMGILAVDYRGYGESQGRPSEAGFYLDAGTAYRHLREGLGVPPERIIIYGFSLGTAVAVDLATRVEAAGLMLEGALLSVPRRGQEIYPWLPVDWMARNRFASEDKIARVDMPKLFIHARGDRDIPMSHGRALFELASGPKEFLEVDGEHTTAYALDKEFYAGIGRFLKRLNFPVPP